MTTTVRHLEDLMASLLVMAWMVEARDPYTGGHLWRVSRYSRLLASDLGLPEAAVARISIGGFLHDLGKIGIPDAILRKPGRLTDDEFDIIRTHPDMGWRSLAGHPLGTLVKAAVLSHHERPDGSGYPARLAGDEVPLDARIVGVCDAFDAMTSARPYRKGMPRERALAVIQDNLGLQFDHVYGERFIALGSAGGFDHIIGHSEDGIPLQECPMCGPTVVVTRDQATGSCVYCRNCGSEFLVDHADGALYARATGRRGTARDLEPEADTELIARFVRESARNLALSEEP